MDITVFGGRLKRGEDGLWRWADTGEVEPRVRDLTLGHLAPSWPVYGGFVHISRNWREQVRDEDVARAVEGLLSLARPYPSEGLRRSYILPVEEWDRVMGEVVGAQWPKEHEEDILRRAGL